jgi:hypothetical protein
VAGTLAAAALQRLLRGDLSKRDFVYVWADGVHLKVRLDEAKTCVLVLVGVRADGSKELIAMDEGYRESRTVSPLSGLMFCARCGRGYYRVQPGHGRERYRCASMAKKADTRVTYCGNPSVLGDVLTMGMELAVLMEMRREPVMRREFVTGEDHIPRPGAA